MFSRLMLPVTYGCNLNCDYCYVDKKSNNSINLKTAIEAVDFLIKNNKENKIPISIIFVGGEPLLQWKKMLKIILYAKHAAVKRKIKIREIGFPTNGLLLKKNILDFCRKENIRINVSIDGLVNKRKTLQNENSFLLIKKKISLLLEYKDIVRIKITVHPDLAENFENIFQKFAELGFTKIDVQPAMGISWSVKQKKAYLNGLEKTLNFARNSKNNIDIKNLRNFFDKKNKEKYCPKIKEEFMVDLDGKIYPCDFFMGINEKIRGKYSLGDIYSGVDIKRAKRCQKNKICDKSEDAFALKNKCSKCKISPACFKVCLGINIKTKKFDPLLAKNGWPFARDMEKVFEKYKK